MLPMINRLWLNDREYPAMLIICFSDERTGMSMVIVYAAHRNEEEKSQTTSLNLRSDMESYNVQTGSKMNWTIVLSCNLITILA